MVSRTYSIDEIQRLVQPVARRYGVQRVMLFGSYARGDASEGSDIDLRIDSGEIQDYFMLSGFHQELEDALALPVDVLTTGALDYKFINSIRQEEIVIYEQ